MKTLFDINREEHNSDNYTLLMEIGQDYFCYAFLDEQSKAFDLIRYITFEDTENPERFNGLFNDLEGRYFERVVVCSAFSQALLMPQKYYNNNNTLLEIIYDDPNRFYLNDAIPEWQMVNVYSIPNVVHELVLNRFPSIQFYHAYTPSIKVFNGYSNEDQIEIDFSTKYFRVMIKKDQQIHLAQTYAYKSPLDVIYFLLKICYEFKLDQSTVFIIVSGLISEHSAMYGELNNYFLNLHFAQVPEFSLPDNEHPHYYFNSLYKLAACVL